MADSTENFAAVSSKDVRCKRVQCNLEECSYPGRGNITELEWKDYCPEIFRNIQEHANVNHADYTVLLCAKDLLREISSPGKPGRMIILSTDQRFGIKTLRKSEMKVILEALQKYFLHIRNNTSTLLLTIYGLHSVRQLGGLKVYFVTFANPIPMDMNVYGLYSLKGSLRGRKTHKMRVDEHIILKDFDFDYCFYLNPLVRERLLAQIKTDCDFLESEGIVEYFLLLGLAMQTSYIGSIDNQSYYSRTTISASSSPASSVHSATVSTYSSQEFQDAQMNFSVACQEPDSGELKYGRGLTARAVRTKITEVGGKQPESFNVTLYFEIVDFYQKFNVKKRIERLYKSIQYNSKAISAVRPQDYSSRFQDFLEQIFLPDDSLEFATCTWNAEESNQS